MENTLIRIREAEPADAALVADIARRTFIDSFAQHNTAENMRIFLEEQNPREKQMAEVGAPGRTFLLAYMGEEPAGYVSLRVSEPPQGLNGEKAIEIVQIYSEKTMIGKGIGPALMQAALDLAQRQGFDWVWLGVWEHNYRAQAFYRKWGFEPFGEHVFLVGLDAQTDLWMRKKLG
ncbi:GNAT family N-acetyltransferase [Puia sp.]|jgi:ribosomal protein S18 acetylase RimI-like enzyme|uniref:GNAT family N-acetyltransferase n=1 Tax=Puia sp. TaxID=2045100 RepID=UPI002F419D02